MYNVRCETREETRRQTVTVTGDCDYELSRDHEVIVDLKKENLTYIVNIIKKKNAYNILYIV